MTIIWDWNGTLLNDTDICIASINKLLIDRKLTPIDQDTYREIFTFPVKDYYIKAGFDFSKENFDIPAHQFIDHYRAALPEAGLHNDAVATLETFRQKNYRQFILSAMEHDFLINNLEQVGIAEYFEKVSGIQDHFAHSKIEVGKALLDSINHDGKKILLIGDTIHDHEVASELGIECILVSHGHQSEKRLKTSACRIVNNLKELTSII